MTPPIFQPRPQKQPIRLLIDPPQSHRYVVLESADSIASGGFSRSASGGHLPCIPHYTTNPVPNQRHQLQTHPNPVSLPVTPSRDHRPEWNHHTAALQDPTPGAGIIRERRRDSSAAATSAVSADQMTSTPSWPVSGFPGRAATITALTSG